MKKDSISKKTESLIILIVMTVGLFIFILQLFLPDANKSAWPVVVIWGLMIVCFWIVFIKKYSKSKGRSDSENSTSARYQKKHKTVDNGAAVNNQNANSGAVNGVMYAGSYNKLYLARRRFANSVIYSLNSDGDQIEIVKDADGFHAVAWNDGGANKTAAVDYGSDLIPDSIADSFYISKLDDFLQKHFGDRISIVRVCPEYELQFFFDKNKSAKTGGSASDKSDIQAQKKYFVCSKCKRQLPLKYLYREGMCADCFEKKLFDQELERKQVTEEAATAKARGTGSPDGHDVTVKPGKDLNEKQNGQNTQPAAETAKAVASAMSTSAGNLNDLAAEKDARSAVTEKELIQCFAEYFAPNKDFYSTPGSEKFQAYFGAINAARDEMLKNPVIFSKATKWDIARLAGLLNNPQPGITNMIVCGLIFRTGDYGVLKSIIYCVDFCENIPNCIALYLFLTAHRLPEERRKQTIDVGDNVDKSAFQAAMDSLKVLDPKWSFTIL